MEAPSAIAEQFKRQASSGGSNKYRKLVVDTGLAFLDIAAIMLYVLIWGCVIVFGASSVAIFVLGVELITTLNIANLIPYIPYVGSLIFGISCLGMGVLVAFGTVYAYLFTVQLFKILLKMVP